VYDPSSFSADPQPGFDNHYRERYKITGRGAFGFEAIHGIMVELFFTASPSGCASSSGDNLKF
jgi:hypothetical protein